MSEEIENLKNENAELKSLLEDRTKLLSTTIHDISSPLTIAHFEIQMALNSSGEKQEKSLKHIEETLDKMAHVIAEYKKAREQFVAKGEFKKVKFKKVKDFLNFYLGQSLLLNDVSLIFNNEDVEINIDEEILYKKILKPIVESIIEVGREKEISFYCESNNGKESIVIHSSLIMSEERVESLSKIMKKSKGDFDNSQPEKIIIQLN